MKLKFFSFYFVVCFFKFVLSLRRLFSRPLLSRYTLPFKSNLFYSLFGNVFFSEVVSLFGYKSGSFFWWFFNLFYFFLLKFPFDSSIIQRFGKYFYVCLYVMARERFLRNLINSI